MISSRRRRRFLLSGGEASPFDPTKLPNLVALYDISDLSTLFVERTGASASTPASVNGVVGTVLDLSGNGNHATAPSDAARPILRESNGLYWLEGDGVDDLLQTGPTFQVAYGSTIAAAFAHMNSTESASLVAFFSVGPINNWHALLSRRQDVARTLVARYRHILQGVPNVDASASNAFEYGQPFTALSELSDQLTLVTTSGINVSTEADTMGTVISNVALSVFSAFGVVERFYAGCVLESNLSPSDRENLLKWLDSRWRHEP